MDGCRIVSVVLATLMMLLLGAEGLVSRSVAPSLPFPWVITSVWTDAADGCVHVSFTRPQGTPPTAYFTFSSFPFSNGSSTGVPISGFKADATGCGDGSIVSAQVQTVIADTVVTGGLYHQSSHLVEVCLDSPRTTLKSDRSSTWGISWRRVTDVKVTLGVTLSSYGAGELACVNITKIIKPECYGGVVGGDQECQKGGLGCNSSSCKCLPGFIEAQPRTKDCSYSCKTHQAKDDCEADTNIICHWCPSTAGCLSTGVVCPDCNTSKTAGDCPAAGCSWCSTSATCSKTGTPCPDCSSKSNSSQCSALPGCAWCGPTGSCKDLQSCPLCDSATTPLACGNLSAGCKWCNYSNECRESHLDCSSCSPLTIKNCSTLAGCHWCDVSKLCISNSSKCPGCLSGARKSVECLTNEWCEWCQSSLTCAPGNLSSCVNCSYFSPLGSAQCIYQAGCTWCSSLRQCIDNSVGSIGCPRCSAFESEDSCTGGCQWCPSTQVCFLGGSGTCTPCRILAEKPCLSVGGCYWCNDRCDPSACPSNFTEPSSSGSYSTQYESLPVQSCGSQLDCQSCLSVTSCSWCNVGDCRDSSSAGSGCSSSSCPSSKNKWILFIAIGGSILALVLLTAVLWAGAVCASRFRAAKESERLALLAKGGVDFDKPTLYFGLETSQAEINKKYTESFLICNNSDKTAYFSFAQIPQSERCLLTFTPSTGSVRSGKTMTVEAEIEVYCTTKLSLHVPCSISSEGSRKERIAHYIDVLMETVLSSQLDSEEIIKTELLGEGAFGVVWKGEWRGTVVAVKSLKSQLPDSRTLLEFSREVTSLEKLRSPYVVQMIGAVTIPGKMCIVTEYLPLGSVASLLRSEGTLSDGTKLSPELWWLLRIKFAVECARGMRYLHSSNILHRDLKPSNLMVASVEPRAAVHCKLSDFGTTRDINEAGHLQFTLRVGTPNYMAPELLSIGAAGSYSQSADVFSYAIVLWELYTQKEPYADKQEVSRFMDVVLFVSQGNRLDIPEGCPEDLVHLIKDCWGHDPESRPPFQDIPSRLEALEAQATSKYKESISLFKKRL